MLDKKEKILMKYLSEVCINKKTYLISADQIARFMSNKYLITINEIEDLLTGLSKDNYLEFVAMDGRKGYYYCITLKNKGLTFKKDLHKEKKQVFNLITRTVLLGFLSFMVGFILKIIFKG